MSFTRGSGPSYGLNQPYVFAGYKPIVSRRAPTVNDRANIGATWIDTVLADSYTLVGIANNQAVWLNTAGGAGIFATITVSGLATFNGSVNMAPTAAASTITLGNAGMTGAIIIGNSTALAGQAISIGGAINTGAQSISLGSGASAANSTVNILTGNATAGIQTFNVMTGTRAGAVNISTGAAAHTTIIGTVTAASSVKLQTPTSTGVVFQTGATAVSILCGAGDPNTVVTATKGSLYLNTAGSGVGDRAWINTTGAAVWTAVTTVA